MLQNEQIQFENNWQCVKLEIKHKLNDGSKEQ